jgi:hypothetical protein
MELDDLKLAWQTLDRKLDMQNLLVLQHYRHERLDRIRSGLWPMRIGQIAHFVIGIALICFAVPVWVSHWPQPLLVCSGLALHIYGVAQCIASAHILWMLGAIDPAAPVLTIQQQLARLRVGYLRSSFWLGNAWWVMWIPLLLVAAVWENPFLPDDAWSSATRFVAVNTALGIVAIFAVAILMRLWRKRNPDSLRRFEDRSSRGIASALRELDELARFERVEI